MRRTFLPNLLWITVAFFYASSVSLAFQSPSGRISSGGSGSKAGKTLPSSAISSIDSLLNSQVMLDHVGGAVVQVAQDGTVLYTKAYGYAEKFISVKGCMMRRNNPDPMTTDDMFDLASLTKVFATTFGIMMLVDQGKIHLDDPVHLYLKRFVGGGKSKITIRELLNHTSGLNEWQPLYYHAHTPEETYRYICKLPLKYEVGEARHYSDLGFMMLGYLIQHVTGEALDVFLSKELYGPLGLKHTVFNPLEHGFSPSQIAATSQGNPFEYHMVADPNFVYKTGENVKSFKGWRDYTLRGEANDGNSYYANGGVAGHAGLFSTASDLQVLVDLMVNDGTYGGRRYIKAQTVKEFTTMDKFKNGLGWDMEPNVIQVRDLPPDTYGHTGFTGTSIVIVPEYKLSILLLTNRENVGVDKAGYYYNLGPVREKLASIVMDWVKSESGTK